MPALTAPNPTQLLLKFNAILNSGSFFCWFSLLEDGRPIPGVILLIDGGMSSIEMIHNALDTHPRIPVVIMAHSGRAASVLSEVWEQHDENGFKG